MPGYVLRRQPLHRARLRTRGAALVEGLIVAGLLVVCLGCVLFAHRLYSAKLATVRQARLDAWGRALPGCGGANIDSILSPASLIDTVNARDVTDDDVSDWLVDAQRGVGSAGPTTVPGPHGTGMTFNAQARVSVACNEVGDQRPRESNFGSMWGYISELL
jgi:hypothetical protein